MEKLTGSANQFAPTASEFLCLIFSDRWKKFSPRLWVPTPSHLLSLMALPGTPATCLRKWLSDCHYNWVVPRFGFWGIFIIHLKWLNLVCSWRLYIAYICPFAQRAWIARNYKVLFTSRLFSSLWRFSVIVPIPSTGFAPAGFDFAQFLKYSFGIWISLSIFFHYCYLKFKILIIFYWLGL